MAVIDGEAKKAIVERGSNSWDGLELDGIQAGRFNVYSSVQDEKTAEFCT